MVRREISEARKLTRWWLLELPNLVLIALYALRRSTVHLLLECWSGVDYGWLQELGSNAFVRIAAFLEPYN